MYKETIELVLISNRPDRIRNVGELLRKSLEIPYDLITFETAAELDEYLLQYDSRLILLDGKGRGQESGIFILQSLRKFWAPILILQGVDQVELKVEIWTGSQEIHELRGENKGAILANSIFYALGCLQSLRTSKSIDESLQTIVDNDVDGIVIVDRHGYIQFVNPAAEALFGRSAFELVNQPFGFPITSEKPSRIHILRSDGRYAIAEMRAVETEWKGKSVHLASLQDMTETFEAEQALQESEEKFRLMAEHIEAVFWMSKPGATELVYVSPSYEKIWGRPLQSVYDNPHSLVEVVHPNDREQLLLKAKDHVQGHYEAEYRLLRDDGSIRWIYDKGSPVYDEQDNLILMTGIATDITERKEMEEKQKKLEEQLFQSQKMEAIGQLAGGVAHDFNNILLVIRGYSHFLLNGLAEDNALREDVTEIDKAVDRASALTRQLLAFSRRQILQPEILNLNDIIANLEKMLRRLIGEDIEFKTTLESELGSVNVDPGQIEQVIMNLTVNARDAMPHGGILFMETANVALDEVKVEEHYIIPAGNYAMIAISDTGIGMDNEMKRKIFEPFFTTKEEGKGTGLGLSTVYGIVKQSEGYINVYSEPGQGTTFRIYFPRIEQEKKRKTTMEIPAVGGNETILVVEDDELVRKMVCRYLGKAGYQIIEAESGEEAISMFEDRKEKIDLILSDVIMPQMSGRQLADQAVTIKPEMKILYMSGYTDDAIVHHGVLEPDVHFLQKPFTQESLLRKVREALDQ